MEERWNFIASLYKYLLKREATSSEIQNWLDTNLEHQDLVKLFTESEEFKKLCSVNQFTTFENLDGLLVTSKLINTYLLYPVFDQVQLTAALQGEPFQLNDFLSCLKFLIDKSFLNLNKKTFLDIGANIGSTSVYALKTGKFDKVISFEPSDLNYKFLKFNAQINEYSSQIEIYNYGLANFIGEKKLVCNPINCGDFRIESLEENREIFNLCKEEEFTTEMAKFTTLDELLRTGQLVMENIGFIWMDCQGSEGLIFEGGKVFFQEISVPLYVEFWPYGIERLGIKNRYFEFLRSYARQLFRFVNNEPQNLSLNDLNEFYTQNISTGDYFDILIIPNKT